MAPLLEAFQVIKCAAMYFGTRGGQCFGPFIRTTQTEHTMAGGDQLFYNDRTDPAGGAVTNTRMSSLQVSLQTNLRHGLILVK